MTTTTTARRSAGNHDLPTYYQSAGAHTSSNGFVNYVGTISSDQLQALHRRIHEERGPCVIVDGDDNWSAPIRKSVPTLLREFDVPALAMYHSGISGITRSGAVLAPGEWNLFSASYRRRFGAEVTSTLRVVDLRVRSSQLQSDDDDGLERQFAQQVGV